uniref:Uncharacterized protein n=1 Tax=Globodera rostochiensis TaxID=31243 RepID=A0A914IEU0_GLORO
MCGESFIHATFVYHRQKCSDGLPRFGCPARKDFYHQNGLWIGLKALETSAFKNKTKEQLVEMRNAAVRELAAVLSEEPGPKGVYIKCLPDKLSIFGLFELREELAIDMSGQRKMDADGTPASSMESLEQLDEMPGTSAASEDPWQRHAPKGWEQKPPSEWTKTEREMFNKKFLEKSFSKKPQSSSQPNKY